MPDLTTRKRNGWPVYAAMLALMGTAALGASPQYGSGRTAAFAHAERLREALEGRPEQQRTRLQYQKVLDAYRAIYHSDPASPKADASIAAVADLLAEEGRVFQDAKLLRDAIGQYEFLRKEYPASRFRFSALLTEGEIEQRDFGDLQQAKTTYQNFLRIYPASPLAVEAKGELRNIRRQQLATGRTQPPSSRAGSRAAQTATSTGTETDNGVTGGTGNPSSNHRKAVLTAAIQSQQEQATRGTLPRAPASESAPGRTTSRGSTSPQNGQTANQPTAGTQRAAGPGGYATRPDALSRNDSARAASAHLEESDIPPLLTPTETGPRSPAVSRGTEPAAETTASADLNAPPPPRRSPQPLITGIRHWSTPVYTRVAIDLQSEVRYTAARVPGPDRIFFDLYGTRLSPELVGRSVEVTDDGFLSQIRVAQFGNNVVRIVLDVNSVSDYSAFFLANPSRLIIDVHGRRGGPPPLEVAKNTTVGGGIGIGPVEARPTVTSGAGTTAAGASRAPPNPAATQARPARTRPAVRANVFQNADPNEDSGDDSGSPLADVATLSNQPNEVRATRRPTTGPVVASVAGTTPAAEPDDNSVTSSGTAPGTAAGAASTPKTVTRRTTRSAKPSAARVADDVPPAEAGAPGISAGPVMTGSSVPEAHSPNMMRALGLKINRIVIDAGHGGHDSGTLGPGGLQEKDVVLDVALRLGKLLKERLGASVIYTRSDDTFIPLETRTAIANQAQADLFISVHGNSSPDSDARGVEVYYLNFTSSADALEVAARENAVSDESIHQLSDLVKKIALQAKINESREFAADVDQSLYDGLEHGNAGLKDRGVKKAPFVVLIGANMPSILAEISFLTNPEDAQELRQGTYRERIAESLYRGVARYVSSMNGLRVAQN